MLGIGGWGRTNGRIEDLRAAAEVAKGRKVSSTVHAMVVPGSGLVKKQAEQEGLDRIFKACHAPALNPTPLFQKKYCLSFVRSTKGM